MVSGPDGSPNAHDALRPGIRLGEFEVERELGQGGFSVVYLAWDHSLQRKVALKEYLPVSLAMRVADGTVQPRSERTRETFDIGLRSFINEARALAQFDHAALVKVHRFWEARGTAYMVMPYYEGRTLKQAVREAGRPPDERWLLDLLDPLTEALAVIHAANWYHRDIAPDNVLLLAGSGRPLLLDFGAARRVIGESTQALTAILKPGYAPVEQYADLPGLKQGAWTDLYALAATVYWMLSGQTPPPSVGRMLQDTYLPLSVSAQGSYSAGFLAAMDRALAVLPEQRTRSIAEFRQQIGLAPTGRAPSEPFVELAAPVKPSTDEATVLMTTRPSRPSLASTPPTAGALDAEAAGPSPPAAPAAPDRRRMIAVAGAGLLAASAALLYWRRARVDDGGDSVDRAVVPVPAASAPPPPGAPLPTPEAQAITRPPPAPAPPTAVRAPEAAAPASRVPSPRDFGVAAREAECAALLQRLSLGEDSRAVSERLAALRCR